MPVKTIHGAALHYEEAGRGVPLALIHGFPLDQRIFDHQSQTLAQQYRVIRPDLRGLCERQIDQYEPHGGRDNHLRSIATKIRPGEANAPIVEARPEVP